MCNTNKPWLIDTGFLSRFPKVGPKIIQKLIQSINTLLILGHPFPSSRSRNKIQIRRKLPAEKKQTSHYNLWRFQENWHKNVLIQESIKLNKRFIKSIV